MIYLLYEYIMILNMSIHILMILGFQQLQLSESAPVLKVSSTAIALDEKLMAANLSASHTICTCPTGRTDSYTS